MAKPIVTWTCLAGGGCLTLGLLAVAACSDSASPATPVTQNADSGPVDSGSTETDAGVADADAGPPKPGVLHFVGELAPQIPPDAGLSEFKTGANLADYPGAAAAGVWGVKPPKLFIPGAIPGLGCQTAVFNMDNPPPSAPDQGDLTIKGFTGGSYLLADGGTEPLTSPAVCKRVQNPVSGLFDYQCPFFARPATNFFDKTDTLLLSAPGGADVDGYSVDVKPPLYEAVNVSTNLTSFTHSDFDGSKDLKLDYDCDGADCDQAGIVGVFIQTTDNSTAATPFDFNAPKLEGSVASCLVLAATATRSYTFPKELLAGLPKSYAAVRVTVTVLNVNQTITATKGMPILFAGGFGRFGITRFN